MNEIIFKTFMTVVVLVAVCSIIMVIELSSDVWRERATKAFMGLLSLAIATAMLYLFLAGFGEVWARDLDGKYAQQDPKMHEWFETLKDAAGHKCCADADGLSIKDADWESKDGHYRVRVPRSTSKENPDPIWVDVPDSAVIKDPNLSGRTIVWPIYSWPGVTIRCFIPGVMMQMDIRVKMNLTDEQANYIDACCRIRQISRRRLVQRLMKVIIKDMLVQSILDDDGNPRVKLPGEQRIRFVRNRVA